MNKLFTLTILSAALVCAQATTGWVRTDAANTWTGVQTLTSPIINNAVVNGPAAVSCGASCTLKPGVTLSNLAAGTTATLPTSSGSGSVFTLIVSTTTTSAAVKVLLATTTDVIIGTGIGWTGSTAKIFAGNAGTYHSIQMPYSGSQPSGGFQGDTIVCTDVATGTYNCNITYEGGTTPTTPYGTGTT